MAKAQASTARQASAAAQGSAAAQASTVAQRCAAQLLSGPPAGSVTQVVRRLLAVQAQDGRGARLAVRARSAGLSTADVERALSEDRSVVVSWLNRGTLHLVLAEDYWWLHELTTPQLRAGNARRLAQEGVPARDADAAVGVIDAALAADGPLTRAQLGERVAAAGIRARGQAIVHLLARATIEGRIVRGPMAGREQAFVRVGDWLGAPPPSVDRDVALAELARRYLGGHGPASERDLAKWAGLPLRDARRGLAAIGGETRARQDGLAELAPGSGEADTAGGPGRDVPELPPPRLLGAFDPLLHGWVDRDPVLGPYRQVITVNGLFRPFALADGRAVATWTITAGKVEVAPFGPIPDVVADALRSDAADVLRFLGITNAEPGPAA